MTNEHYTLREFTLYAMQELAVEQSDLIRAHLQICSACRSNHAQVCVELALMGLLVQQRELPVGARERFIKRIGASVLAKPQDTSLRVTTITVKSASRRPDSWLPSGGSGLRIDQAALPGTARIREISRECLAASLDSTRIVKKSLLHMTGPTSITTRIGRETASQITPVKPAPDRVAAARSVNIF